MASSPRSRPRRPAKSPSLDGKRSHERDSSAHDSVGLCGRPFELHGAGQPGALGPAADTTRCRSLLDALLRTAWPGEAGAWSDALIAEFGSLPAALAVGAGDRARAIGPEPARFLGQVQAVLTHCLRHEAAARPIVSTSRQLLDYLKADMANLVNERFRVLFLTSQNELLADDLIWEGTVGEAPAYPREVVKRALEVGATGLILVHNHPSGDPSPSPGDVEATKRIAEAALMLGICLHDHIIVSRAGWSSFRTLGLLDAPRVGQIQ
jgi:DNA repair protein RadC